MIENAHLQLLRCVREADPWSPIPDAHELAAHLEIRLSEVGPKALTEFAHVQREAARKWGAAPTAHFGQVLRAHRVTQKPRRKSNWEKAACALRMLPEAWQPPFDEIIRASQRGIQMRRQRIWSAAFTSSVLGALRLWADFNSRSNCPSIPTGEGFSRFAEEKINGVNGCASASSVADYLDRILIGYSILAPDAIPTGAMFVAQVWRHRGKQEGSPSKTGAQLVGASEIYQLGFALIDEARRMIVRGPDAARQFRNGLLLALGIALPQRARALSCLSFGTTLKVAEGELIRIEIPASMLKRLEARKAGEPYSQALINEPLQTALLDYMREFRPIFDEGPALFPSMLARGAAISEAHIGRLTGDMTQRAFGVRVTVHRLRDNVATEASEYLSSPLAASALLGHRSSQTTARHYDHYDGVSAARAFAEHTSRLREHPVPLVV
ncbi:hypothetical protein [Paracoccus actinidiae]|uniref:hypothetical protein n=1 Tax=Paracoccus actinidiae TaxID=3064531 RepID=UPI0027D27F16|nr:hypothetical protein [Paracoccus sp. M09]